MRNDLHRRFAKRAAASILTLLLAGCASSGFRPVSDAQVKIGRPYTVRGVTYTPAADPGYDAVGYASWYGHESGRKTANGERLRTGAVAGAHTTLPLPSYVEVTSVDTGRVVLVRINDRGPFVAGRIVDLSPRAAKLLGMKAQGIAPVRVRVVAPDEADRRRLREGDEAAPRPAVTGAALAQLRARLPR